MDEATRFRWVFFLKQKSDVPGTIRQFITMMKIQSSHKVKRWHSDNEEKFIFNIMTNIVKTNEIMHEFTTFYNSEQNESAEKSMHTIWNDAKTLFKNTNLNINLWSEMIRTKIYLINRSSTNALKKIIFYETWKKTKSNFDHLRIFGNVSYKITSRVLLKITSDRVEKCILLNYEDSNQYRIYNIIKKKMKLARNVRFQKENHRSNVKIRLDINVNHDSSNDNVSTTLKSESRDQKKPNDSTDHDESSKKTRSKNSYDEALYAKCQQNFEVEISDLLKKIQATIARLQEQKKNLAISISVLLVNVEAYQSIVETILRNSLDVDSQESINYKKVMTSSQQNDWRKVMKNELASHEKNDIWKLKLTSINRKVLKSKWVYKLKRNFEEKIQRYKARWVVRKFEQKYDIDFNETFAAIVKSMTYKILFAMIAFHDWNIEQMNVKTAFFYENLNEVVYCEMLIEFEKSDMICKLRKALYDLKQTSKIWFKTLIEFLKFLKYHVILEDSNVYHHESKVYVVIYVDDLLILEFNRSGIANLKRKLSERFCMIDLDSIAHYLELKIQRNRATKIIRLSQKFYLRKIIVDFNFSDLRKAENFMNSKVTLQSTFENFIVIDSHKIRYQSAIDSLMYFMLRTRSDIAFEVSQILRFAFNLTDDHWTAIQRIFRYLKKYFDLKLIYCDEELLNYTDANWAKNNDRKSTESYLYKLEKTTISWNNKRQNTIALFSCEIEYMTASEATKKTLWMRRLLKEFDYFESQTVIIQVDNKSAIALTENSMHHDKTKHIEIRYHFIREKVIEELIRLKFVFIKNQVADGLIKLLAGEAFSKFIKNLGLEPV